MSKPLEICIVGAGGQLGQELAFVLDQGRADIGEIDEVYKGANVTCVDLPEVDITDKVSVNDYFENKKFDMIINCAGFTNVDGCEDNEDAAFAVNATGTGNLAKAASEMCAKFVHISTDYVFSGEYANERVETDDTDPISAYGRGKLEGEKLALENCKETFILRTAWLYGRFGQNFVFTMLNLAENLDEVTVVADQYGNPTYANDLAYQILEVAKTDNFGIYHATGEGICTWADLAEKSLELAGKNCKVKRTTTRSYRKDHPQSAPRPHYSALENKRLTETVGNKMRDWQEALSSFIVTINNKA